MKVTLTVINKFNQINDFVLFGSRNNYLTANHGNNTGIEITNVEPDEEYKSLIGDFGSYTYSKVSAFIMDCVKYDLFCTSIKVDGKHLKNESGELAVQKPINTYNESFKFKIFGGENKIELEFNSSHHVIFDKRKRLLIN